MYVGWLVYMVLVAGIAGGIVLDLFVEGVIDLVREKRDDR